MLRNYFLSDRKFLHSFVAVRNRKLLERPEWSGSGVGMYRPFFRLALFGVLIAISVWIPALLIHNGWLHPFLFLNGYPADFHSELMVGLFVLPTIHGMMLHAGLIRRPLFRSHYSVLYVAIYLLLALGVIVANKLSVAFLLLFLFCALFYEMGRPLDHDRIGTDRADFFVFGTLFGAVGSFFWAVFAVSAKSFAFAIGKSLLFYGTLNLFVIGAFLLYRNDPSSPRFRASMYLYAATYLFEIGTLLFTSTQASLLYGGVVRSIVTLWWIGKLVRPMEAYGSIVVTALVRFLFLMYGAGLIGHAVSAKDGTQYAHFMFAMAALPILFLALGKILTPSVDRTRGMGIVLLLFLFAGLTRATAYWMPTYLSHLAYGAFLFLIGWGVFLWLHRKGLAA